VGGMEESIEEGPIVILLVSNAFLLDLERVLVSPFVICDLHNFRSSIFSICCAHHQRRVWKELEFCTCRRWRRTSLR